jgi:3-phosphoshikimate 1-carboxyvinyltransferase
MELESRKTSSLNGTVKAPPSKSYTHRAIMLAGLSKGKVRINDPLLSEDPLATIDAMRKAGAKVDVHSDHLIVTGNAGKIKPPPLVDVKNSGTTLRILASVFSLCDKRVRMDGDSSIRKRPMGPLISALERAGVSTSTRDGNPPISVQGPIKEKLIQIRGDMSSQYISGLLIACPLRSVDTTIEIIGELKSRPYLDLTLEAMEEFGIRVENHDYKSFFIKGNQMYSKMEYTVEGDYSGAAFVLGAATLTDSHVTMRNLFENSRQGDKQFLEILKMLGAKIQTRGDEVTILGSKPLRAIEVDLSQSPDLLPMVSVMCSLAKGTSRIFNVEHARIKECDRISAMALGLQKMGVRLEEKRDGLVIEGRDSLIGAEIESHNDHRIVMAFAVAGMRAEGVTRVNRAESVNVSYPTFVRDMKSLGADFSILP